MDFPNNIFSFFVILSHAVVHKRLTADMSILLLLVYGCFEEVAVLGIRWHVFGWRKHYQFYFGTIQDFLHVFSHDKRLVQTVYRHSCVALPTVACFRRLVDWRYMQLCGAVKLRTQSIPPDRESLEVTMKMQWSYVMTLMRKQRKRNVSCPKQRMQQYPGPGHLNGLPNQKKKQNKSARRGIYDGVSRQLRKTDCRVPRGALVYISRTAIL